MKSITEWLIDNKIAHHQNHAQNIIAGLQLGRLWELKDFDGIEKRARLYRRWRDSQVYGKQTAPCFEKAIAGVEPPKELFAIDVITDAQGEAGREAG